MSNDSSATFQVRLKSGMIETKNVFEVIDKYTDVFEREGRITITYDGCKKLARSADIVVRKCELVCKPTKENRQQHCVFLWLGYTWDTTGQFDFFGDGEASCLNTGSFEQGSDGKPTHNEWHKVDSQFKLNMAVKRAYSRALLHMVNLIGMYGSDEFSSLKVPDLNKAGVDLTQSYNIQKL